MVAVWVADVASTHYHGVAERAGCDAVFPLLLADVALVESAVSDFDFILCCHIRNVLAFDIADNASVIVGTQYAVFFAVNVRVHFNFSVRSHILFFFFTTANIGKIFQCTKFLTFENKMLKTCRFKIKVLYLHLLKGKI